MYLSLSFSLSQDIHLYEKDFDSLISTLTAAADYAHQVNAPHTRILCLLAKGAVSPYNNNNNKDNYGNNNDNGPITMAVIAA